MTDDALRQACIKFIDSQPYGMPDINALLAFAKSQRAAGIREEKAEVERIHAGLFDHDRGLEAIQEWCDARAKELES